MFEERTKISSTDKFFGNFFISEISCLEHFIDSSIFLITVLGFTMLLSMARAIVKVLKIEPSSYTLWILLRYFFSNTDSFINVKIR